MSDQRLGGASALTPQDIAEIRAGLAELVGDVVERMSKGTSDTSLEIEVLALSGWEMLTHLEMQSVLAVAVVELAQLRAAHRAERDVLDAAKEVVHCWTTGRMDQYAGICENKLTAAVNAWAEAGRASAGPLKPSSPEIVLAMPAGCEHWTHLAIAAARESGLSVLTMQALLEIKKHRAVCPLRTATPPAGNDVDQRSGKSAAFPEEAAHWTDDADGDPVFPAGPEAGE